MRVFFAVCMIPHGWAKLVDFETRAETFMSLPGLTPAISLLMALTAEILASLGVMGGLCTRLSSAALTFTMLVALYMKLMVWGSADVELILLYIGGFIMLMFTGPGRISLDHVLSQYLKGRASKTPSSSHSGYSV